MKEVTLRGEGAEIFMATVFTAMETIRAVLMKGHIPCAVEFLDRRCLELMGDLLPFSTREDILKREPSIDVILQ